VLGDRKTKEAVVLDIAWDPKGVRKAVQAMGYNITAFVATHFHWDHIGNVLLIQLRPSLLRKP
jgi:glyoxylase-like metal-dependent hydrolase (beta-lactamase superfamily II)